MCIELRNIVGNVQIPMSSDNLPDHCPVELDIEVPTSNSCFKELKSPLYVNWKKLSDTDKSRFQTEMETQLSSINMPYYTILHGEKRFRLKSSTVTEC